MFMEELIKEITGGAAKGPIRCYYLFSIVYQMLYWWGLLSDVRSVAALPFCVQPSLQSLFAVETAQWKVIFVVGIHASASYNLQAGYCVLTLQCTLKVWLQ